MARRTRRRFLPPEAYLRTWQYLTGQASSPAGNPAASPPGPLPPAAVPVAAFTPPTPVDEPVLLGGYDMPLQAPVPRPPPVQRLADIIQPALTDFWANFDPELEEDDLPEPPPQEVQQLLWALRIRSAPWGVDDWEQESEVSSVVSSEATESDVTSDVYLVKAPMCSHRRTRRRMNLRGPAWASASSQASSTYSDHNNTEWTPTRSTPTIQ